jgi:tetratricopeptide (TPR) repeat protein
MLSRVIRTVIVVFASVMLAACAQLGASRQIPERNLAAIDANQLADSLFRRGDFEGAAKNYREALRIARSIEAVDDIAANVVNLSIALQRLGRPAEARAVLALVGDQSVLPFAPTRLAQVALRRSILELEERQLKTATEWADKAGAYCKDASCSLLASVFNVKGQIALESASGQLVASNAVIALKAARDSGNQVEIANALRLLGQAATLKGDTREAYGHLSEALEIDRQLGLPSRISMDLVAFGKAKAQGGDRRAASAYYERALAVMEADRDVQAAATVRSLLHELDGTK